MKADACARAGPHSAGAEPRRPSVWTVLPAAHTLWGAAPTVAPGRRVKPIQRKAPKLPIQRKPRTRETQWTTGPPYRPQGHVRMHYPQTDRCVGCPDRSGCWQARTLMLRWHRCMLSSPRRQVAYAARDQSSMLRAAAQSTIDHHSASLTAVCRVLLSLGCRTWSPAIPRAYLTNL